MASKHHRAALQFMGPTALDLGSVVVERLIAVGLIFVSAHLTNTFSALICMSFKMVATCDYVVVMP